MKIQFKKSTLAVLITALTPIYGYSSITVDSNGSNDIPKSEMDGSNWLNDPNLTKSTVNKDTLLDSNNNYIPKDNNNNISKNNVVNVINTDGLNINNIYGSGVNRAIHDIPYNTYVIINSGNIGGSIYGSYYSYYYDDSLYHPEVKGGISFNDGVLTGNAYGAYVASISNSNSASDGVAYINGGTINGSVYGAYNNNGSFSSNGKNISLTANGTVYITDGIINKDVTGAFANSEGDNFATLKANGIVNTSGGVVNGEIRGVYVHSLGTGSYNLEAKGSAYINNTKVEADVYGINVDMYGAVKSASDSSVYLGNSFVGGNAYGVFNHIRSENYSGMLVSPDLNLNVTSSVNLNNQTTVSGDVAAVHNDIIYNNDTSNLVSLDSNTLGAVNINGGNVDGNIYGVYTNIQNIGQVDKTGHTSITYTSQADVSIFNDVTLNNASEIWGGYLNQEIKVGNTFNYEIFKGNTFTVGSSPLTISNMGNFEHYDFYLNDYNKVVINDNSKALITVTDEIRNDNTVANNNGTSVTTKNSSIATIKGISGTNTVKAGDSIVLINASGATINQGALNNVPNNDPSGNSSVRPDAVSVDTLFEQTPSQDSINLGLAYKANINYVIDNVNQTITAVINSIAPNEDNIKPLAEGRIAALQNTVRGADLLMSVMGDNQSVDTFTPIAVIDGSINKYNSGSSVDSRDYRLMVGTRYQFLDDLYAGITVEYGRSNYDTHNDFASDSVDGDGHTYNYGVSLFTKYTYDLEVGHVHADAALRFGKTNTEFKSGDIVMGNGDIAHYKSKVNYIGGIIGTGYLYPLNETSSFDTSLHYLYTRLGSDSIVLDGDKVNFQKSTSSRVQLKEQYNYKSSEAMTFYLAGIYEYEFDGKAKANVSGISIDAPSVKGSTGIMEMGVKATPIADNHDLKLNLSFKGYGGKRDGVGASVLVEYDF